MADEPTKSSLFSGIKGAFLVISGGLLGILFGIAIFTFGYAGGWAYFGSDPATCNQCHAMNEQYDSWAKGSHKAVAGCNDCHAPHDNLVHKYMNKADNGFWHALKFTTGDYPENIRIREMNREITREACLYCHGDLVKDIEEPRMTTHNNQIDCLQCHADVGHMR